MSHSESFGILSLKYTEAVGLAGQSTKGNLDRTYSGHDDVDIIFSRYYFVHRHGIYR